MRLPLPQRRRLSDFQPQCSVTAARGLGPASQRARARPQARREFRAFCAANPMDIVSVECQPEACVLAKGRAPAGAGLPAGGAAAAPAATPLLAGLLASLPVPAKSLTKGLGLSRGDAAAGGAAGGDRAGAAGAAGAAGEAGAAAGAAAGAGAALGEGEGGEDEGERADSRAERMLESHQGGGGDSLGAQLLARQQVAYRRAAGPRCDGAAQGLALQRVCLRQCSSVFKTLCFEPLRVHSLYVSVGKGAARAACGSCRSCSRRGHPLACLRSG